MATSYEATLAFEATRDDYEQGYIGEAINWWDQTITADTLDELKQAIVDATYIEDWGMVDVEDGLYYTGYLANEDNQGDASDSEVALWREGKCKLFAVDVTFTMNKVTKEKVVL